MSSCLLSQYQNASWNLPFLVYWENFFFNFFLAMLQSTQDLSSLTRDQTCTPPQWKSIALTIGPPGKSWVIEKDFKELNNFSSCWHPRLGNLAFRDPCCRLSPLIPFSTSALFFGCSAFLLLLIPLWRESFGETKIIGLQGELSCRAGLKWIEKIIFLHIMFLFWKLALKLDSKWSILLIIFIITTINNYLLST